MRKGRGEVKRVGDLFAKYKNTLVAPQKTVVLAFTEVVFEVLGIAVDAKVVRYTPHTQTLSIQVSGPLKSEIALHRDEILAHLKGRLGERNAPKTIL